MFNRLAIFTVLAFSATALASGTFGPWGTPDGVMTSLFARQLELTDQGPLRVPNDGISIRLIWSRTFHNPVIVRVNCVDECEIAAYRLNGQSGYWRTITSVLETKSRKLDDDERETLLRYLEMVDILAPQPESHVRMEDGATWIIELSDRDSYGSWSTQGTSEEQFRDYNALCRYVLDISLLAIDRDEIY